MVAIKAIKASPKSEKERILCSPYFHSHYLIGHCKSCKIWKRLTKDWKINMRSL